MKLKLLFLLLTSQLLFSQVTFTEVKKLGDTTKAKNFRYDGKSEFAKNLYQLFPNDAIEYYMKPEKKLKDLSNYYKQYIGYDIFFLGKPKIVKKNSTKKFIDLKENRTVITKL